MQGNVTTSVSIAVLGAVISDGLQIVPSTQTTRLAGTAIFLDPTLLTSATVFTFAWSSVGNPVRW